MGSSYTHPQLWRRTDQPIPPVVTRAQNALTIFDIGSHEEVLEEQRRLAAVTTKGLEKDIAALRAMLTMPEDDVDLVFLVAACANVALPDPTPEASRAWIERYVTDIEQIVAEATPAP